ncbi:protein of unknown function [Azospirillum baldaniorum]|uniref:Uncharacterized protein n=1 Tax=Azospirillum baldaniorum TaxID=1064539 RepID=A0A9P1JMN9_9PROT|nr:protein of unknown function [Azospirillum baldaniorum]
MPSWHCRAFPNPYFEGGRETAPTLLGMKRKVFCPGIVTRRCVFIP